MFDSSDVQSVFSGNIAEEWEKKSRYINSLNGNDNMMIPTIKKYITSTSKILDKTTPRLIQFHTLKNAVNPPFLGGFSIFNTVVA